jgi:hypothetical protein
MCKGLYSDILTDASLRNNCNPIVAIFIQKALYGLRDNVTLEVTQAYDDDYGESQSDSYKDKYRKLIQGEP